jgi:methionine synthase II (cobalamin-independent)
VSDQWAWAPGSATGVGSMPGTDIDEAVRIVLGELPDFPHLPELPDRGPGADLLGRGAALLVELPIELYANRWRIAARPGHDLRVARDLWERDLDTITEQAAGYAGAFKIQVAGPFTLAAGIELPTGGAILHDHGAVRDLVESLAEGVRAHVAGVRVRLPQATLVVQVDEPSLPAALAGRVPTESGFGTLRAIEEPTARDALAAIIEAAGVPVAVHCCAPDVPIDLVRTAGAAAVSLDLGLLRDLDPLGEALDAGLGLIAGAVDTRSPSATGAPSSAQVASRVREIWAKLGFPTDRLAAQVVVAPACGLAGTSPDFARSALAACRDAGRRLHEE